MKLQFLFFVKILLIPFFLSAQSSFDNLAKAYSNFKTDSQISFGLSSITVADAETGEILFSDNSNVGLSPASTLKTITGATAFHFLGEAFTWETKLSYTGTLTKQGVLTGDLVITSFGDPTLGSSRFSQTAADVIQARWINAIKKAGIKKIEGRVISDDSFYGTQIIPIGWIWQDMGNYYGAASSAVCWNENLFDAFFQPGTKPGDPVTLLRTEPAMPYLKIVNEVTTGVPGSGDRVYAYSAPYSDVIYFRGTYAVDLKKKVSASIPDPAFEASFRLQEQMAKSGIQVSGAVSTWRRLALQNEYLESRQTLIDTYASPVLSEVNNWFNKKSINLYGENMLKAVAVAEGKKAETEEGVKILQSFWSKRLNVDKNSICLLDGSGLSPENKITTLTMVRILQSVQKEKWFGKYYDSFPEYNGMRMKSGTMRNVLGYAGYHRSKSGRQLVFSFIVNNHSGSTPAIRAKMFKVLDELK